jgi:hypothetical protein
MQLVEKTIDVWEYVIVLFPSSDVQTVTGCLWPLYRKTWLIRNSGDQKKKFFEL